MPTASAGTYLFGIVPGDVDVDPDARGVGDPPGTVQLVRHRDIAAMVSEIDVGRPLGRPQDLLAHQRLLDATVTEVPVLPIRFGAVVTGTDAVVDELLAPNHDELLAALREMDGKAQYIVKSRYVEAAVLGEILEEQPEAGRLRAAIRGTSPDATRAERVRLGELITRGIEAKRQADVRTMVAVCEPHSVAMDVREPAHELDAANVALLAETAQERRLVRALEDLARKWDGRVTIRLLGPQAPYDFVTDLRPEG
ncbi:GvpL/GvpF family gas vesicle protein [Dactylosporangium sp. NBC_01737]|uniref:GvpL/GvpF family gas vesicle protein n=1 Tax=Dactylosporangium sp. NBC_01737 TaxID=2975959 RepID=UPI002E120599|nr:GvpL/GvpF family gas vesicle protein [Dactylosporangium sp. NBC_01737]